MPRFFIIAISLLISTGTHGATAIFAGGCFWCVEADFDKVPGVNRTLSGFDGGVIPSPSYKKVSSGTTRYVESVKITYDAKKVSYRTLVKYFLMHIDPTDGRGQFCDRGKQYRPVIFYQNKSQKDIAYAVILEAERVLNLKNLAVELLPSTRFYPAEDYHQNYAKNHKIRYNYYRWRCGRDKKIKEVWREKSI